MWRNGGYVHCDGVARARAGWARWREEKRQPIEAARSAELPAEPPGARPAPAGHHAVGLILPNLLNADYTALADEISRILAARGYHLMLSPTGDDPPPRPKRSATWSARTSRV